MENYEVIKQDVHDIKNELQKWKLELPMIREIHESLTGNKISKDGGLVKRVENVEIKILEVEESVESIKISKSKQQVFINIIYGAIGALLSIIVSHFINK